MSVYSERDLYDSYEEWLEAVRMDERMERTLAEAQEQKREAEDEEELI